METMTIHRGLSELKLIDTKIEKQLLAIIPSGINQKGKLVNGHITAEDFTKSAQSNYDSIQDLITRKINIKSAIVKANSNTSIIVAGKTMTIADAINFKASINFKKVLIQNLTQRHNNAIANMNKNNEQVNANLQRILEATFSKDNAKVNQGDVEAVSKPYLEANESYLFDPLKTAALIESLEKEVMNFEAEVDATLSEINAITQITI